MGHQEAETENNKYNKLFLYPNPANESIIIGSNIELKESIRIDVFDVTGREVAGITYKVKNSLCFVNTSSLTPGIYSIIIYFNDHAQSLKFVIAR